MTARRYGFAAQPVGSAVYQARHRRVEKIRGKAYEHLCSNCCDMGADWALRHGRDPRDPASYDPLCRRCHTIYDGIGYRNTTMSCEDIADVRARLAWGEPISQLAAKYKINYLLFLDHLRMVIR